jgi:hypothetical protein
MASYIGRRPTGRTSPSATGVVASPGAAMGHYREQPQRRGQDRSLTVLDVMFIGMLVVLLLAMAIGVLFHS